MENFAFFGSKINRIWCQTDEQVRKEALWRTPRFCVSHLVVPFTEMGTRLGLEVKGSILSEFCVRCP